MPSSSLRRTSLALLFACLFALANLAPASAKTTTTSSTSSQSSAPPKASTAATTTSSATTNPTATTASSASSTVSGAAASTPSGITTKSTSITTTASLTTSTTSTTVTVSGTVTSRAVIVTGAPTKPSSKGFSPSAPAIVVAAIAALLALGCILWAVARWRAWEPHWALSLRHSLAEAGYHVSATWAELLDWARLGR